MNNIKRNTITEEDYQGEFQVFLALPNSDEQCMVVIPGNLCENITKNTITVDGKVCYFGLDIIYVWDTFTTYALVMNVTAPCPYATPKNVLKMYQTGGK